MPNHRKANCIVCNLNQVDELRDQSLGNGGGGGQIECPRCGKFNYLDVAIQGVMNDQDPQITPTFLSGWIREQNEHGTIPDLVTPTFDDLIHISPPTFLERSERLLSEMLARTESYNRPMSLETPDWLSITYSRDEDELSALMDYLHDLGLIRDPRHGILTPEGIIAAEELHTKRSQSIQCFVAMRFNEEMQALYDQAFAPAIVAAGYKSVKVDRQEHINQISDEIIALIRRSRFMVADLSHGNQGVYYEAGFALGLGLPIIYTCQEDAFSAENVHFDIRQYNCLIWKDGPHLSSKLQSRIEAVLGRGSEV